MMHIARVLGVGALGLLVGSSCGILGCAAPHPPKDVVDARAAYQLASTSPGANRASKEELKKLVAARHGQDAAELAAARADASSQRQARVAAEQRTNDALAKIAGMSVTETERGLVLTPSGSVLFATNKSVLLPGAEARLNDAANALAEEQRPIVIVGHTDSIGSDEANMALSRRRAEAVRAYLVGSECSTN